MIGSNRISIAEVRVAVERLHRLGFLEWSESGYKALQNRVSTPDDIINRGARVYLQNTMDLAKEALDVQSVEEREYQSFTVAIPLHQLSLAKQLIRKFRTQFCQTLQATPCDQVYQFNLQFFRLTEHPLPALVPEAEVKGIDTRQPTHPNQGVNHVSV